MRRSSTAGASDSGAIGRHSVRTTRLGKAGGCDSVERRAIEDLLIPSLVRPLKERVCDEVSQRLTPHRRNPAAARTVLLSAEVGEIGVQVAPPNLKACGVVTPMPRKFGLFARDLAALVSPLLADEPRERGEPRAREELSQGLRVADLELSRAPRDRSLLCTRQRILHALGDYRGATEVASDVRWLDESSRLGAEPDYRIAGPDSGLLAAGTVRE